MARPTFIPKPSLPPPALLREVLSNRRLRDRYFDPDLFADPAWDIMLDLAAAQGEHQRVSITSLCLASGVAPTTALRWVGHMVEKGLLQRSDDLLDRRRAYVTLTDRALRSLARYFADARQSTLSFL